MPSQPSSAAPSTGSVRLAHVFVRIPSGDQQGAKKAAIAAAGQGLKRLDGREVSEVIHLPSHTHSLTFHLSEVVVRFRTTARASSNVNFSKT